VTAGFLKIILSGRAEQLDEYRSKYDDSPIPELDIQAAGGSIALALAVPEIDPIGKNFADYLDAIPEIMEQLSTLISLAKSRGDL
jgi:hypothetical protein